MDLIFSHCLLCPKLKKKKKKHYTNTHTESLRSPAPPRLYSCFFLSFFFRCFQGLQKIKIKTSYLIKGTEVGMHDQCHRLNNLILTFLANFVKGQSSARIRRILETCLILQWVFSHTVKKTNKQETLTNSKVGICKTSV